MISTDGLCCFKKMCLASEAGKMDTSVSSPEDSSSSTSLQQTAAMPEIKEENTDTGYSPPLSQTLDLSPPLTSVTPNSTDAMSPQLCSQNACVKKKSKKKEMAKSTENTEVLCLTKKKTCDDKELNVDSVFSTIESVAKGTWKDPGEKPKKKIQSSLSGGEFGLPKKKSKPKVSTFVKDKEEDMDDDGEQCGHYSSSEVEMKEDMTDVISKTETKETNTGSTDLQGNMAESHHSPCTDSPTKLKEEDMGKERQSEVSCESNQENRGSRKSERSCKGALYKTLVSEGMLTSLRANIDRGTILDSGANCFYKITED